MATVPGAPVLQQPRPLTLSQELEFYWAEPASDGGSAITSYVIFDGTTSNTLPSNTRSYRATGLANGTVYQYRVAASNAIGLGSYSFFRAVQPGFKPDVPTNVSYSNLGNLQYNITWVNPTDTGQASLTRGFLQAIPVDGGGNILSNVSSFIINRSVFGGNAGASNSRILGLNSNYNYKVLVRVVNDPGYSLPITYTSTIFTAPFSPDGIGALRLWLDATASSNFTLSTNYISTWTDRSANSYKVSQTTQSNFPSFSTNFVTFSSFQYLNLPQAAINNVSTWTMMFYFVPRDTYAFINAKQHDANNTYNLISYGATTNSSGAIVGGLSTTMYIHTSNGGSTINYPIGFSTNTMNLVELRYDGQSNLSLWNNGFLWSTFTGDFRLADVTNATNTTFGALIQSNAFRNPSTSAFSLGSMLFYSTILAPSNIYKLEGYLANQYGLQSNLPVNHPYYNTLPTNTDTQLNFSPSSISSLQLWLDANDATSFSTVGGTSSITQWTDRSGQGRHASSFEANNPVYVPTGLQSGKPGVYLTSGSTLITSVPSNTFASSVTFFTVFQKVGLGPAVESLITRASNAVPSPFSLFSNTKAVGDGPTGNLSNTLLGMNINTRSTLSIYSFNATRFSTIIEYLYGGNINSNLITSNYYRDGASTIIFGNNNAKTQPFTGYLSETFFYSSTLTFGERQAIEGYLAWKWGNESTLATSHPFRFQPPTVRSLYEGSNGSFSIQANNNSTLVVQTDADLRLGTGDFTAEWWQWIDNSVGNYIWGYGIQNAADLFVTAQGDSRKAIRPWFNGTALGIFSIPPLISTLANSWHHIALVRSTGTLRCFYNGMSSPTSIAFTSNLSNTTYNLHIGYVDYKGYIDDFHITKGRALYWTDNFVPPFPIQSNASTVLLLNPTNRGRCMVDKGPLRKNIFSFGTMDWTPNYWPDSIQTFGTLFATGGIRYARTSTLTNNLRLRQSSFTIEWFYNSQNPDTDRPWSLNYYPPGPQSIDTYFDCAFFNGGQTWSIGWDNSFPPNNSLAGTLIRNSRSNWNHYAITREISTVRMFQNGVLLASTTNSYDFNPASSFWCVGGQFQQYGMNGWITNFHIVNGQALYTSSFVPPSIPIQPRSNSVLLLRFDSTLTVDSSPLSNSIVTSNSPSWFLVTNTRR